MGRQGPEEHLSSGWHTGQRWVACIGSRGKRAMAVPRGGARV